MIPEIRKLSPFNRLVRFIRLREDARHVKRMVGGPGPHSDDPILAHSRFCNINREHDAVTQWVKANVRDLPLNPTQMVVNVLVARIFNEPETLRHIVPFSTSKHVMDQLAKLRAKGQRIMRGAYMMPTHGPGWTGKLVEEYHLMTVAQARAVDWRVYEQASLASVADRLLSLHGVGPFVANQIVTDLRYTRWWDKAEDWKSFVLCGPGSRRGLDRLDGCFKGTGSGCRREKVYTARIHEVHQELAPLVPPEVVAAYRDPNNVSNTFCEWDKYERALWSDNPRLRRSYK
jgi:hypothetical protein